MFNTPQDLPTPKKYSRSDSEQVSYHENCLFILQSRGSRKKHLKRLKLLVIDTLTVAIDMIATKNGLFNSFTGIAIFEPWERYCCVERWLIRLANDPNIGNVLFYDFILDNSVLEIVWPFTLARTV